MSSSFHLAGCAHNNSYKGLSKPSLMVEYIVEELGFMGNDEAGTYRQALIVNHKGEEHYILMSGRSQPEKFFLEKLVFPTKDALLKAFPGTYIRKGWQETDERCGFEDISLSEFREANRRGRERVLKGLRRDNTIK